MYQPEIPDLPTLKKLRLYLLLIAIGGCTAFFIPFKLSLNFQGKIASDGPTSEIVALTDALIEKIASENQKIQQGNYLFKFRQPIAIEESEILKARMSSVSEQLISSQRECDSVYSTLADSLKNARKVFNLKREAYNLEAISQLSLMSAQSDIDNIRQDIAAHKQRCSQEFKKLSGDKNILENELKKQQSSSDLTGLIIAPSNGYLHRIRVKNGQQVTRGQALALFTSDGTTGATLNIPLRDRPFVKVGDIYLVSSNAYQILTNPPVRECLIKSISPDSFESKLSNSESSKNPYFEAQCQFKTSPLGQDYPFLVGMQINASAASVQATLIQIILEGYRRLVISQQATSI